MKNIIIAGAIFALTAVSAQAGGLLSRIKPDASIEYGFNSEVWSGDVGATLLGPLGVSVRPSLGWSHSSSSSISISGAKVKSVIPVGDNLSAYSQLSLDSDFKYSDISLGVALSF